MRIKEEIFGKEVLNASADVLGRVKDVEVNPDTNEMEAFVVSKGGVAESLGFSNNDLIIPIERVKQIGDKILLEDEGGYTII